MKLTKVSQVCYVQCVALAEGPTLGPTRVRLCVSRRRWCCWPWRTTKRALFTLDFRADAWLLIGPSEWENISPCCVVDLEGLRKLQADMPVQLKVWTRQSARKVVLDASLGEVLDQMESCTGPATFRITATTNTFQFSCPSVELESPVEADDLGGQSQPGKECDGEEGTPVTADTDSVMTEGPSAAEHVAADNGGRFGKEESLAVEDSVSDGQWVTFISPNGVTVRLPAHTPAEKEETWRGPGAWTSQEDLLDAQALEIIGRITSRPYTNVRGCCGGAKLLNDTSKLLTSTPPSMTVVSERQQSISHASDPVAHSATAENLLPTFSTHNDLHNVPSYQSHEFSKFSATRELRVTKGISKEVLLTWGFLLLMVWLMIQEETGTVRQ